jgi:hypothetical protein
MLIRVLVVAVLKDDTAKPSEILAHSRDLLTIWMETGGLIRDQLSGKLFSHAMRECESVSVLRS